MKLEYIQIYHSKNAKNEWAPGNFRPKSLMHTEDAEANNRHFDEHGILCVPKKEYEKFVNKRVMVLE